MTLSEDSEYLYDMKWYINARREIQSTGGSTLYGRRFNDSDSFFVEA